MQLVASIKIVELTGLSRAAISKACRAKLKPACVGEGKKLQIDLDHPIVIEYIDEKRRDGTTAAKQKGPRATPAVPAAVPPGNKAHSLINESGQVINLEELTVRQVAMQYGSLPEFNGYVKALKDIADYKNKEQQHLVKRGELIEREAAGATLFALVDVAYKRLVSEMPDAVIQQLIPLIQSGGDDTERDGRKLLVDSVSKILKDCKAEVRKRLKELDKTGGDNDPGGPVDGR